MNKRHSLGQHFLVSESIAKAIVDFASLTKNDIVLEIGTGKGILIPFLCKSAKEVISVEKDIKLHSGAVKNFSNFSNLKLKQGDGFKMNLDFTVFVSNLPYSASRRAIEWLIQRKFSRAIIMVQKEFAEKLLTKHSDKNYRAITVLANHCTKIDYLLDVKKMNFSPQPKVDSVVIKLVKTNDITKDIINTVNKLFSYRRKTIRNITKQFGIIINSDRRLEDLTGNEIINIAKQINKN